jgi:ferredoxin
MSRPVWLVNLIKWAFPSRFKIAAWARKYPLFGKFVDFHLFRGDDVIYLPKEDVARDATRRIPVNAPVTAPEETVLPSRVAEHFVRQAEHIWIMDTCFCRDAEQCEDYPIDLGCIFMGEATRHINPKLGHPASQAEALAHLERAQEAGLVHMIGRNRIDSVWLGAKPYDRLMTICHCCPCCCLWRVLPDLPAHIEGNITRMPGVTVRVTDACVGCGACTQDVCFVDAIRLEDGRAVISDACRGCGRCVEACPHAAIELTIEDPSAVESAIERLAALVNMGE